MAAKLKITLIKSTIGYNKDQAATARSLGLKKMNSSVEQNDNAVTRGMIHKIQHLVAVEQVKE